MQKAPFSEEMIQFLNSFNDYSKHPYTCDGFNIPECQREQAYSKRREGETVPFTNENEGVLIATENGFICPCRKYKQDWCH